MVNMIRVLFGIVQFLVDWRLAAGTCNIWS